MLGTIQMPQNYWLDLFTGTTWEEFLASGATVSGFRPRRWKSVQRMRPGDLLLCYATGVSRWIGVLEVTGEPFWDDTPIWASEDFPARIPVQVKTALKPEHAVPISLLLPRLSFHNPDRPKVWAGAMRGSPVTMKPEDAKVILAAIEDAIANPVVREYDQRKWYRTPKAYESSRGPVTIPDGEDEASETTPDQPGKCAEEPDHPDTHESIQMLLIKLGSGMGLDVWIARNDRNRLGDFTSLQTRYRLRDDLPTQFDKATNRTIELIDVLWLRGNSVEAAFEIEHTSAIYSGLLRMSDLVAMQPNLNIRLFIVAPDERRERVLEEIARPTFSRLPKPLYEHCKYLAYSDIVRAYELYEDVLPHLKPDFLDKDAESAAPR